MPNFLAVMCSNALDPVVSPSQTSLEISDLTDQHIYQLANILDEPGLDGNKEALNFIKRLELSKDVVVSLGRQQSPTRALLKYLANYGSDEQRQLSYLIQKLLEDPPMRGAAKILQQANQI